MCAEQSLVAGCVRSSVCSQTGCWNYNEEILVFQFQSGGVIRDTKDAEAGNNHRAKCVYSVYSVEV